MPLTVKICGVTTHEALAAALDAGADMIGFVFFPKSPRHLSLAQAGEVSRRVEGRAQTVALLVNPEDEQIDAVVRAMRPDLLQLHGAETPDRVADIRKTFGVPILKAFGVADSDDLAGAETYRGVADRLLLDAKPPKNGLLPGGNGLAFDWTLVRDFSPGAPWMLSGGLTPDNVGEAIRLTGTSGVDVSSGVEDGPGQKSLAKIRAFVAAARLAQDQLGLATGSV